MSDQPVPLVSSSSPLVTIQCVPASDGWGFVGRVMVGDRECYRTLSAYTAPTDAIQATQALIGHALGSLLAAQEWRSLGEDVGHVPTRRDLRLGLSSADGAPRSAGRRSPTPARGITSGE